MSGWKRILLAVVGVLLIVGGGAYYWLIVESHMPADAHFELDMNKVRAFADGMPGDRPVEIQVEKVAQFTFPATAVVAGDGWSSSYLPVFSYQLVYPDGRTGIVDTALSKVQGGDNLTDFDPAAYDRMETAIGRASFILLTHEHMDHIGGLAAYPKLTNIISSVDMTKEQIDHPERSAPVVIAKDILGQFKPVVYDQYLAIAPGVVLIKAPGHSPGSQIVYVHKQDGTEVLLIGDVPKALDMAEMGLVPQGSYRNRQHYLERVLESERIPRLTLDLLADPQTSGGLFIAVDPSKADDLCSRLTAADRGAYPIGWVSDGPAGTLQVI